MPSLCSQTGSLRSCAVEAPSKGFYDILTAQFLIGLHEQRRKREARNPSCGIVLNLEVDKPVIVILLQVNTISLFTDDRTSAFLRANRDYCALAVFA